MFSLVFLETANFKKGIKFFSLCNFIYVFLGDEALISFNKLYCFRVFSLLDIHNVSIQKYFGLAPLEILNKKFWISFVYDNSRCFFFTAYQRNDN